MRARVGSLLPREFGIPGDVLVAPAILPVSGDASWAVVVGAIVAQDLPPIGSAVRGNSGRGRRRRTCIRGSKPDLATARTAGRGVV